MLQVGDVFGSYKVVRLLGQGGMGSVFLLEDEAGGLVAAKILDPSIHGDYEYRVRFLREAEIARKIKSPTLVTVFDIGEDPDTGLCYILMEYVGGGTLKHLLAERGRLQTREALEYVLAVARALKEIHSFGVVHRDIKPDNIMFTEEGRVKIADLGIARGGRSTTITKSGLMIGTPAYMAPEQMTDSHHVDLRGDVYSLGIVLYELLAGCRPNHNAPFMELMANAVKGVRIPDIRTENEEVPADVAKLIAKMSEPQADKRFANMAQVIEAITEILEGKTKRTKFSARFTKRFVAAGLGLLAIIAISVASFNNDKQDVREADEEKPVIITATEIEEEPVKKPTVEQVVESVKEEEVRIEEPINGPEPLPVIETAKEQMAEPIKEVIKEPIKAIVEAKPIVKVEEKPKPETKAKPKSKKPKACTFTIGSVSLQAKVSEEKRAKEVAEFGNKVISITRRIMALPQTAQLGKGKIKKFVLDANSIRVYLNPVTKVYHIGELAPKQKIFEAIFEVVIKEAEFAKDAADKSLEQFVKMQVSRSLGLEYNSRRLNREQRLWQVVFDRDSQVVSKYLSTRKYFYRQGILMGKMSTADFVATLSRAHGASLFLFCQEAGFEVEERRTIINCRDLRKFGYDSSELDFVNGRITDPFDF